MSINGTASLPPAAATSSTLNTALTASHTALTAGTTVPGAAVGVFDPVTIALWAVIGLVVGLVGALTLLGERLTATVTRDLLTLEWDDAVTTVPRHLTDSVVLSQDLVVLGPESAELARVRSSLSPARLREALRLHGWPEPVTQEPDEDLWSTWEPRDHRLSPSAQRFLAARATALRERAGADAEHLRRALVSQGIMVRERRSRGSWHQQWRRVPVATLATARTASRD